MTHKGRSNSATSSEYDSSDHDASSIVNEQTADAVIQSSFIAEMDHVSQEVKILYDNIKKKETDLILREKDVMKRQLKLDSKEKYLTKVEKDISLSLKDLENGSLESIQCLQNTITDLRKDNLRMKDSFSNLSQAQSTLKTELQMYKTKSEKLEKQLMSANGRIKNFISLQHIKPKEESKENIPPPKNQRKKDTAIKPKVKQETDKALPVVLIQLLSNINLSEVKGDDKFYCHILKLLPLLAVYLENNTSQSAVVHYPCLKLILKCITYIKLGNVDQKLQSTFRHISECLVGSPSQYFHSPHLHSRMISAIIVLHTSSQTEILRPALKGMLVDFQVEGSKELMVDNGGTQIILEFLSTRPVLQLEVLNILVILTGDWYESSAILKENILPKLPLLIDILSDQSELLPVVMGLSVICQRMSLTPGAKSGLVTAVPLFRRLLNDHKTESLICLNLKSVLFNIECDHQIPV